MALFVEVMFLSTARCNVIMVDYARYFRILLGSLGRFLVTLHKGENPHSKSMVNWRKLAQIRSRSRLLLDYQVPRRVDSADAGRFDVLSCRCLHLLIINQDVLKAS